MSATSSRRNEIEAAWSRINLHVESLRRLTGELADAGEDRGEAAADVLVRLSRHGAELRAAVSHLEGLGRATVLEPPASSESPEASTTVHDDPELRRLLDVVHRRLRTSRKSIPALEDALTGLARYVASVYGTTLDRH